jgi:hypothetical protein
MEKKKKKKRVSDLMEEEGRIGSLILLSELLGTTLQIFHLAPTAQGCNYNNLIFRLKKRRK